MIWIILLIAVLSVVTIIFLSLYIVEKTKKDTRFGSKIVDFEYGNDQRYKTKKGSGGLRKINNFILVYFIWVPSKGSYTNLISSQLNQVATQKFENIYVEISCEIEKRSLFIGKMVENILPQAKIKHHKENRLEYYGIRRVWELSHTHKNSIIGYMHNKGMSHGDKLLDSNRVLFDKTFENIPNTIDLFNSRQDVSKVCLFPSLDSFGWFNFWIARPEYISILPEPKEDGAKDNYWHWEFWLGTVDFPSYYLTIENGVDDIYSLIHESTGVTVSATTAVNGLFKLETMFC